LIRPVGQWRPSPSFAAGRTCRRAPAASSRSASAHRSRPSRRSGPPADADWRRTPRLRIGDARRRRLPGRSSGSRNASRPRDDALPARRCAAGPATTAPTTRDPGERPRSRCNARRSAPNERRMTSWDPERDADSGILAPEHRAHRQPAGISPPNGQSESRFAIRVGAVAPGGDRAMSKGTSEWMLRSVTCRARTC